MRYLESLEFKYESIKWVFIPKTSKKIDNRNRNVWVIQNLRWSNNKMTLTNSQKVLVRFESTGEKAIL